MDTSLLEVGKAASLESSSYLARSADPRNVHVAEMRKKVINLSKRKYKEEKMWRSYVRKIKEEGYHGS